MRNKFADALANTLRALRLLGIEMDLNPTSEMAESMFEEVKNQMLAIGFDSVLQMPRATDAKMEIASSLLSDAGTYARAHYEFPLLIISSQALHAYWNTSGYFTNVIGLSVSPTLSPSRTILTDDCRPYNSLSGKYTDHGRLIHYS